MDWVWHLVWWCGLSPRVVISQSAVVKLSGKLIRTFRGPAAVFDGEGAAYTAIMEGRVPKGSVLVIRRALHEREREGG